MWWCFSAAPCLQNLAKLKTHIQAPVQTFNNPHLNWSLPSFSTKSTTRHIKMRQSAFPQNTNWLRLDWKKVRKNEQYNSRNKIPYEELWTLLAETAQNDVKERNQWYEMNERWSVLRSIRQDVLSKQLVFNWVRINAGPCWYKESRCRGGHSFRAKTNKHLNITKWQHIPSRKRWQFRIDT